MKQSRSGWSGSRSMNDAGRAKSLSSRASFHPEARGEVPFRADLLPARLHIAEAHPLRFPMTALPLMLASIPAPMAAHPNEARPRWRHFLDHLRRRRHAHDNRRGLALLDDDALMRRLDDAAAKRCQHHRKRAETLVAPNRGSPLLSARS